MQGNNHPPMPVVEGSSIAPAFPLPIPLSAPVDYFRSFRFILAVFLMLFSAYIGSIYYIGSILPLTILTPLYFHKVVDWFLSSWMMFTEFLICKVMGIRVRHFGDPIPRIQSKNPRSSLLIMNHRTQLDWLFSWGLGYPVQQMKIILKESLCRIPGAGWAMQAAAFIFLRRHLATDELRISNVISYLLGLDRYCQVFMFPEGTDLNEVSLGKSNRFATRNDLPFLQYTMHPRLAGFIHIVNLLGKKNLKDIYDVTVIYPDNLPSPVELAFSGLVPREVHYHVHHIPANELPWNEEAEDPRTTTQYSVRNQQLADWLQARWFQKEAQLKHYYDLPPHQRKFGNERIPDSCIFQQSCDAPLTCTLTGWLNTVFWAVTMVSAVYLLSFSWTVRVYFLIVQSIFVYLTYFKGGLTSWALEKAKLPRLTVPPEAKFFSPSNLESQLSSSSSM